MTQLGEGKGDAFSSLSASQIVETDAGKVLVSVAKATAYNKAFGTGSGQVAEGDTTVNLTGDQANIDGLKTFLRTILANVGTSGGGVRVQGTTNDVYFSLLKTGIAFRWIGYNFTTGDVEISTGTGSYATRTVLFKISSAGILTATNLLILPKANTAGIKVDIATPTFGWRDLLAEITPRAGGGAAPAFTAYRGGQVKSYAFSASDIIDRLSYHIPHDYVNNSDIHLHVHWGHNGTAISGSLVLDYYVTYAKGHNQSGQIFNSELNIQHTIATADVATYPRWGHFINEIQISNAGGDSTHLDTALLEPDGLIEIALVSTTIPTITGSATSNLPYIFKLDVHYQTTNIGTKQKAPDFYA